MANSLESDPSAAFSFSLKKAFKVAAELLPFRIGDKTCNFSFALMRRRGKISSMMKLKISRAVASSSFSVVSTHTQSVTFASPKSMDASSDAINCEPDQVTLMISSEKSPQLIACAAPTIFDFSAWRNTSAKCTCGHLCEAIKSLNTAPGPTDGS